MKGKKGEMRGRDRGGMSDFLVFVPKCARAGTRCYRNGALRSGSAPA